jgi:hypothetical protein
MHEGTPAMSTHQTVALLLTAQAALLLMSLGASAQSADQQTNLPMNAAVQTEAGQQIPAGAYGIVRIDAPREATLLQLRGVMGSGIVILRSDDSHDCLTVPIRFVAGDFAGEGISTNATRPIRLILRSPRVARELASGHDVVSDMYRISSRQNDPDADIIIQSGLSESHGFVLNPGSSIISDLFGATASSTACSDL